MADVIELKKLTKLYGGTVGVKNISLGVKAGSIFGFLGPNGAGKTTTISMLVDILRPTSGNIKIFGLDNAVNSLEIRQRIGYLAGDFALDGSLTGWQQVAFFGALRGGLDKKYVRDLAERLNCNLNHKIKTLSRGNKQKVGLITALMHQPELLILDEPTSGLDPLVQAEFNKLLLEHKKEGKTAFVSSHVLSEVQEICDDVAFIRTGTMIAHTPVSKLAAGLPRDVQISGVNTALLTALKSLPGFVVVSHANHQLKGSFDGDINLLLGLLAKHKIDNLHLHEADLETVFMKYYGGEHV